MRLGARYPWVGCVGMEYGGGGGGGKRVKGGVGVLLRSIKYMGHFGTSCAERTADDAYTYMKQ